MQKNISYENYKTLIDKWEKLGSSLAGTEEDSVLRSKEKIECKDIFDACKAGDKVAKDIAERYGYYLGKGIAITASVVNPEIIVLGGGVSKAGEMLFDLLKPSFEKYVFPGCKDAKFALAKLGNDAGAICRQV